MQSQSRTRIDRAAKTATDSAAKTATRGAAGPTPRHALAAAGVMLLLMPTLALASGATLASAASAEPSEANTPKTPKTPKVTKTPKTSKRSGLPSVSTGGVGRTRGSTVELQGAINPNGEAVTSYYFQYGPTTAYGSQTTPASLPAGTIKVKVAQAVTGLQVGYHYRLVATNGHGTKDGHDRTYTLKTTGRLKFTTLTRPPAAGQPVDSAITIAGTLSGPGADNHEIALQASPYPYKRAYTDVGTQRTSAAGRFSFSITRLTRSTRYQVVTVDPRPVYSQTILELATVRVTLRVRMAPHNSGLVRLYGTVSPAETGGTVVFELQKAARHPRIRIPRSERAEERAEEKAETPRFVPRFATPLKHATKAMSRFSAVLNIRETGVYRAYVQLPRGPLAPGTSTTVTLHAAPSTKGRHS